MVGRKKRIILILASLIFILVYVVQDSSDKEEPFDFGDESEAFDDRNDEEVLSLVKHSKDSDTKLYQDDPDLIRVIKSHFLHKPSELPLNLTSKVEKVKVKGQIGQSVVIDRILKGKKNGFFIEAGAFDGEYLSNSLFFEMKRNWTGLLVEANGREFEHLLSKHRKSWSAHSCLALNDYAEEVTFDAADVYGGVVQSTTSTQKPEKDEDRPILERMRESVDSSMRYQEKVQCLPLYSLLMALGNPTVDYFSLDVEGAELSVLKTIPFDKVKIRTLSVEVEHGDSKEIVRHLVRNGFKVHLRMKTDIIFVRI